MRAPRVKDEVEAVKTDAEHVTRRAYRVGGSVAVRLPKALAEELGIEEGTPVRFKRLSAGILVEKAE